MASESSADKSQVMGGRAGQVVDVGRERLVSRNSQMLTLQLPPPQLSLGPHS